MLILYMLLLFSKLTVIAQSYDGNWYGQVQNANGNLKAEMNLKTSTNNQVTGQINILANGAKVITSKET